MVEDQEKGKMGGERSSNLTWPWSHREKDTKKEGGLDTEEGKRENVEGKVDERKVDRR